MCTIKEEKRKSVISFFDRKCLYFKGGKDKEIDGHSKGMKALIVWKLFQHLFKFLCVIKQFVCLLLRIMGIFLFLETEKIEKIKNLNFKRKDFIKSRIKL